MKLLLTGALSPLVWGMAERLLRDKHELTFLGQAPGYTPDKALGVYRDMDPGGDEAREVIRASRFDEIIFFFAYQGAEPGTVSHHGALIDALSMMLKQAARYGVQRFTLITDQRVFGLGQEKGEHTIPVPDTDVGVSMKAAEDCLAMVDPGVMRTQLVRVSHLYQPGAPDAFFNRAIAAAASGETLQIMGAPDALCDFLHVDDLSQFINLSIPQKTEGTVHLGYRDRLTWAGLTGELSKHLPNLTAAYLPGEDFIHPLQTARAKAEVDWVPRHRLEKELPELIRWQQAQVRPRGILRRAWEDLQHALGGALPYVELLVFAGVAELLHRVTQTYASVRTVDFWLFYVILMGTIHGAALGTLAAVVACLFFGITWGLSGRDPWLLLYEMDNWLPMAMYFLGGALFGYMRDRNAERSQMIQKEMEAVRAESAFLDTMYRQAYGERNELQKQVLRNRDSFGRIFAITKELDTLQPEQVFLSTLNVMEDVLQNKSVAIYAHGGSSSFARLVVQSRQLEDVLVKSLDLNSLPELKAAVTAGNLFVNRQMLRGYPAYCEPIMSDGRMIAMIALWDVPFDQQSAYFQNLFSIMAGLVEASMSRAMHFLSISPDMYLEHSRVLSEKAFLDALQVYEKMRRQKASLYMLVRLTPEKEDMGAAEFSQKVSHAVRTTDLVGKLGTRGYFALLPQAGEDSQKAVLERFSAAGFTGKVVQGEDFLHG